MERHPAPDLQTDYTYRWGTAIPGAEPPSQPGSWAFLLLPMLEQSVAHDDRITDAQVPTYACVSRGRTMVGEPRDDRFGRYDGAGLSWCKTDYAVNGYVGVPLPRLTRLSAVTAGLSNVIFAGEKSIDPLVHGGGTWYFDEPIMTGGSSGTARTGLQVLADAPGVAFEFNWGSAHGASAQFAMLDGSVATITGDIDPRVMYRRLNPKADGEVSL